MLESLSGYMDRDPTTGDVELTRWSEGTWSPVADHVARESPLKIEMRLSSEDVERSLFTMRTPGSDGDLATGLCVTEGIIRKPSDLVGIEKQTILDPGSGEPLEAVIMNLDVPELRLDRVRHEGLVTSACGLCGRADAQVLFPPLSGQPSLDGPFVEPEMLAELPDRMRKEQEAFTLSGGLHATAVFDSKGELRFLAEDVGRHNAMDKVVGRWFHSMTSEPASNLIWVWSGRASFELVMKAVAIGAAVVAAVGAPSSAAVECADAHAITLVGFLSSGRMNVYSHPSRLYPPKT